MAHSVTEQLNRNQKVVSIDKYLKDEKNRKLDIMGKTYNVIFDLTPETKEPIANAILNFKVNGVDVPIALNDLKSAFKGNDVNEEKFPRFLRGKIVSSVEKNNITLPELAIDPNEPSSSKPSASKDPLVEESQDIAEALDNALIPLNKGIRDVVKSNEGLLQAIKLGEPIMRLRSDMDSTNAIKFVGEILALDRNNNIEPSERMEIIMDAEEVAKNGFRPADIARVARKIMNSRRKGPKAKPLKAINRKKEFARVLKLMSEPHSIPVHSSYVVRGK